ncbi:MAG: gluconokinase [Chloroflexi bacterium]|nr:gluconokinase [Chloroflexota bacterium]
MTREYVLGVDIGTTSCKTVALDRGGAVLSEGGARYPTRSPRPGWAEQSPDSVLGGVISSIRDCVAPLSDQPKALCFAGALHSLLAVDVHDKPLIDALTWADSRSSAQAARTEGFDLYQRTGCPPHPMYPLSKLLWLHETDEQLYRTAARFVSVKEYVLHALTGEWAVDDSLASGSGLLNLHTHDWDDEAIALAETTPARLSTIVPTTGEIGQLEPDVAKELGVSRSTRLFMGASDAALNSVGAGAAAPASITMMIGSSGAVRAITTEPLLDARARTWCYILDHTHYIVGGAINNAGIVLDWLAQNVVSNADAVDQLIEAAAQAPAGAAGLVFLPFLSGERSPNWNARVRGVLFGLSLHHDRSHIARATLEGIGFRLRSVLEVVEGLVGPATEIRATGGFLRSAAWTQILADVLQRTLLLASSPNTSAIGAALLGWHALGELADWPASVSIIPGSGLVRPDGATSATYERLYGIYQDLYSRLGDSFKEISCFQETSSN